MGSVNLVILGLNKYEKERIRIIPQLVAKNSMLSINQFILFNSEHEILKDNSGFIFEYYSKRFVNSINSFVLCASQCSSSTIQSKDSGIQMT